MCACLHKHAFDYVQNLLFLLMIFFKFQVISPIYSTYMEKHLKEAAEQAAQTAVTGALANGKLKSS